MRASERRTRRRRRGRVVGIVLLAVVALALVVVGWVGIRGLLAYQHLSSAREALSQLTGSEATDLEQVSSAARRAQVDTSAAHSLTSDPIWQTAQTLPWIGPQLSGVGTLAEVIDDTVTDTVVPLGEVASALGAEGVLQGGTVDVAALQELQTPAQQAADASRAATGALDRVDAGALVAPLREVVGEADALVADAATRADALRRTTQLLPLLLGADGPRDYLVLFQNNAEWRPLGGIVGATALIRTEAGRISLVEQASSSDFDAYNDPIVELPADVADLYGGLPARFIQNVTLNPDFTVGASVARELWALRTGQQVSGVISLDPIALSYLLEAIGPVRLPSGEVVDASNAVDLLLNGVYLRYPVPRDQDAFFQQVAGAVFQSLAAGSANPSALVQALTRAGDERRLLVWSADAAEQAILDGTTLQGGLPASDADQATFGVYVTDNTGSKMDYYLSLGTAVGWCATDGGRDAAVSVSIRSDAPVDAATLPRYITGGGSAGTPAGSAATTVYVYLPPGAELRGIDSSGDVIAPTNRISEHEGRKVVVWSTTLAPGQQATLQVRAAPVTSALVFAETTPVLNPGVTPQLAAGCEGADTG